MNKKIASLFASVGFDIDTNDLTKLDGILKTIRGNTANLSRNLRTVNSQLNTTTSRMRSLAKSAEAVSKFNNLGGKYVSLSLKVKDAETAVARFGRVLGLVEPRLDSTNFRLSTVTRSYMNLAAAVRSANSAISQTPSKAPRPAASGGHVSGGSRTSQSGSNVQSGFLAGLAATASRFTPTGLVGGTALTSAAVGLNEVRKAGQDQQRMENMLLFSTKSQEEYARSLEFVRKESLRLGLDTTELGKAFAQVNMSARDKMSEEQRRKMFTDMSEYIMVTGAGQEDQKLIFKAVNQMFSLGRIMAEEMNQLTERGVPRQQLYDIAKNKYGVKDTEAVLKLQEKGKLKPEDLLPLLFEQFAKQAKDTGAFAKMQESSIYKQNVFKVTLKQLSKDIMDAGLDKAIGTFFETLTAGLPHLLTLFKGLVGVAKGLTAIVKLVWEAVEAWGAWIGQNAKTVGFLSFLIGLFAILTAKVTGATVSFGILGKVLATIGKRAPILVLLLALFYLFKEYDKYLKGGDTWMQGFADWMIYLAETARLWKEETIGAFNAVKELRFGDVVNQSTKDTGGGLLSLFSPTRLGAKITSGLFPDRNNPESLPTPQNSQIPYKVNPNPTGGVGTKVFGEVNMNLTLDPTASRQQYQIKAPVSSVNTGGLRGQ